MVLWEAHGGLRFPQKPGDSQIFTCPLGETSHISYGDTSIWRQTHLSLWGSKRASLVSARPCRGPSSPGSSTSTRMSTPPISCTEVLSPESGSNPSCRVASRLSDVHISSVCRQMCNQKFDVLLRTAYVTGIYH